MALHPRSRLLVDPAQCLPGIDDREQGFIGFSTSAIPLRDLKRLPGQQQLVIAPVLRVPKRHPARPLVDVPDSDRRIPVQLVPVDLHASTAGQQLEAVVVRVRARRS
jgi:hypothetical protein